MKGNQFGARIFQSIHPMKDVTKIVDKASKETLISIHTPNEGCNMLNEFLDTLSRISIHTPNEGCNSLQFT